MISCVLHYRIDPRKLTEFEAYARMWPPLVERFGGTHRGYWLPSEGADDVAIAVFDFDTLAAYEAYRHDSLEDADCVRAHEYARETRCFLSHERTFMRPVHAGGPPAGSARATGTDDARPGDAANDGDADILDFNDRKEH